MQREAYARVYNHHYRNEFSRHLVALLQSPEGLHRFCLYAIPMLLALAAAAVPPDANFDLANYHYYNAWAFVTGHGARDLAPAGLPSHFNPLLDVPFYWANTHLPGRLTAFLLGLEHSACFALLYLLARTVLFGATEVRSVIFSAGIALAGITAAVSVAELGTTMYDAFGAAGVLLCLYLLAKHAVDAENSQSLVLFAGLVLGAVVGLKLTNVPFAVGIGLAVTFLSEAPLERRLKQTGVFLAAGIAGVIATGGFWMLHQWQLFGNPLFPFFNNVFHSPNGPLTDARDLHYMPHGLIETLFYPFVFTLHPIRTIEVPMRDLRFLALFLAVPAGVWILWTTRQQLRSPDEETRRRFLIFLMIGLALSYVVWLLLFSIRRYGLVFEMLAPLVVTMVAVELPKAGKIVAGCLIAVLVVTTMPATLGRANWTSWSERIVDAKLPAGVETDNGLILMAGWRPKSFVAPFFPESASFVNAGTQKSRSARQAAAIQRRIDSHDGPIFALVHSTEMKDLRSLAAFGIETGRCQAIHATLDLKGPLMLCAASRAAQAKPDAAGGQGLR